MVPEASASIVFYHITMLKMAIKAIIVYVHV